MRRYWRRRAEVILLVFVCTVGGGYALIEQKRSEFRQEVNADAGSETLVIPGGMPVGIYLETEGVMVLGTDKITAADGMDYEPSAKKIKAGDYITAINDQQVSDKSELIHEVAALHGREVVLSVVRNEENLKIRTEAVETAQQEYKLGIWVRDNAQGLGTITYLDADSRFGALGHGIHDVDTNELLQISGGSLYTTSIHDIQKGTDGIPGGLEGVIIYNHYNVLGKIEKNTDAGIFGTVDRIDTLFQDQTPIAVAGKEEIQPGKAYIRCAVEGEAKEYEVEIKGVDFYTKEVNKGIMLEVTDPKLLEVTGGIVQGMSGSPIIQNGKLIGAVTHVFVNHPTKGYGIFIENMLENAE